MAKQTIVTLIDVIDGSEATESVEFSYRGVDYSIDLNDKNRAGFDKAVAKYVKHATRQSGRRRALRAATIAKGPRSDLADIRAWATSQGYEVSARGRVAANIVDAYDAAN